MNTKYMTIGYYICETAEVPECFGINAECTLSVSDCICDHEPHCRLCHGWNPWRLRKEKEEYAKRFRDNETYVKMSAEITQLIESGMFLIDGCFLRKEDALHFYRDYFYSEKNALLSVTTAVGYKDCFDWQFKLTEDTPEDTEGETVGCDIIGWDAWVFHSFLCNRLHEKLPAARFNKYSLLDNSFDETARMAEAIDGKGEPVDWTPVIIRRIK